MNRIAFTWLVKIEFPAHTVRLCEGAFFVWGAETYRSVDAVFGTIGGAEPLNDGINDVVPVHELTLLPPGSTPIATLSQPGYQTSPVSIWLAEYDSDTGLLIGTPDLRYYGQVDHTVLSFARGVRTVATTIVANAARMLERNIGNSLNSAWQKSVWPGDTGHDNGTGLVRQVAWGVEPPQ